MVNKRYLPEVEMSSLKSPFRTHRFSFGVYRKEVNLNTLEKNNKYLTIFFTLFLLFTKTTPFHKSTRLNNNKAFIFKKLVGSTHVILINQ